MNGGAEWSLHTILQWLVDNGHEAKVLTPCASRPRFQGVQLYSDHRADHEALYSDCDVVLTHNDFTSVAVASAHRMRKPAVMLVHASWPAAVAGLIRRSTRARRVVKLAVVYAADWIRDALDLPHESIVLHPPVWPAQYHVKNEGENVTLINCSEAKGGRLLPRIATALPRHRFLGVLGPYGTQITGSVPNLTYSPTASDVRRIYEQTRILLCPSESEGYGRVAVEAMCSGIPVIANPVPGLIEALGDAGLFADRNQPDEWVQHIEALANRGRYQLQAGRCLRRAHALNPQTELQAFERFLTNFLGA